jgi:hypothetical protein
MGLFTISEAKKGGKDLTHLAIASVTATLFSFSVSMLFGTHLNFIFSSQSSIEALNLT